MSICCVAQRGRQRVGAKVRIDQHDVSADQGRGEYRPNEAPPVAAQDAYRLTWCGALVQELTGERFGRRL